MYEPKVISTVGFHFLVALIGTQKSAYAQYAPQGGQHYSRSYGRQWQGQQSNYNQRASRINYYNANAAAPNYQGGNVAVAAPPKESSNYQVGLYEKSAHTEHGRRLGRMLDVYSAQCNDIGAAVDKVAERLQNMIREAQSNQGQGMPTQSAGMGYNSKAAWSGGSSRYSKKPWVPYEEYIATKQGAGSSWSPNAGYTASKKAVWSGGSSRYSKKPWVPYEEYIATKQGAGSSWSPNKGYTASKKVWSSWSKNEFAPQNQGYSQEAWSSNPGYSKKQWNAWSTNQNAWSSNQNAWSSNQNAWSSNQKAWSSNQNAWSSNQNAWSPNPGYSKKTWSPFAGQNKPTWGSGYSEQPWTPTANPRYGQQVTAVGGITESPGMDAHNFMTDAIMTVEVETRSEKPCREKTVQEMDIEQHTASVTDLDEVNDDLELHDHEPSVNKKSGETADSNIDAKELGDVTSAN